MTKEGSRSGRLRKSEGARLTVGVHQLTSAVLGALLALAVGSAVTATAATLGEDLTPLGAEKAGNKDGSIPAWAPERQDVNWVRNKETRFDAWKYKSDKPLYTINASNVDKYADKLSPGQVAAIKQTPGFEMPVYQSRRACSSPKFVFDNTKRNLTEAKLNEEGWGLKDAVVPGIPFPIPKSGIEVMLNQKLRYRGVGGKGISYTFLSPRRGGTEWIAPSSEGTTFYPWAQPGSAKLSDVGDTNTQVYVKYLSPTAMAGQGLVFTDSLNKTGSETFYYFPGQRRVRRMPAYAYDAQQIGFENQYTIDETMVISGPLDRFDWKLVGKREMLIPYNVFGVMDYQTDWTKVMTPAGMETGHRRYELHRVWVVEAKLKAGLRHTAPNRTFYIDEDSWNAVLAEDRDERGQLTKVREGYLVPIYETGSCDVSAFAQYNLAEGRVLLDYSQIGAKKDVEIYTEAKIPEMKPSFYTPDNLRALSER